MSIAASPVTIALERPVACDLGVPVRLILGGAAGLLLAAGYALHPLWWAPWLAPIPLIVAGSVGARQARIAGAVAGAIALVSVLPYYIEINGWVATVLIMVLRISCWISAARLTEAAARRLPLGIAMLVLPAVITALELLALTISLHGASGSLAYSQMDMPSTVQAAAVGGVPAVVFLVLLPGSLAGLLLARGWPRRQIIIGLSSAGAIAIVVALFTVVRLAAPVGAPTIAVTMIATDRFASISPDWQPVWDAYRPAVEQSATPGGLVVLPEKIALLDGPAAEHAASMVVETARVTRATIVVGIEVKDAGVYRNRALIAAPDGHVVWYDKQRLVPGWEARDVPGDTPLLIELAGTRIGIAICKDMHIPSIGREYAEAAALMAVPAWDFGQDGWMGARMTALRAVENGYGIARSARQGFAGAYDRTGRVVIERPTGDGVTIVTARLPAEGHETVYAKIGNVFGWMSVAAVAVLLGWFRIRRAPIIA